MVGERGFEPPTPWSRTRCSTRLSHSPTLVDVLWNCDASSAENEQSDYSILSGHSRRGLSLTRGSLEVAECDHKFFAKTIDTRSTMQAHVHSTTQGKTVLCIDDNEDVLECEKAFLETFGYTVLTAPSGGKALELASAHSVDVIVVDYFMPEINGQEVAVEMRRLSPRAPIIMLSGAVDIPEQALKSVDAFIAKDQLANRLLTTIVQLQEC